MTVLNLTNGRRKSTVDAKDKEILELRKELDETKLLVKAMTELFSQEIFEKARKTQTQNQDIAKRIITLTPTSCDLRKT